MASASNSSGILKFEEVYDIVKNNRKSQFDAVYHTLLMNPDFLSAIPDRESYCILHHIVAHGAADFFNKVIAIPNLRFNLLMKTALKPRKDIQEIANENRSLSPAHRRLNETINNLVKLDRFVDYAKRNETEECKKMLEQDEELVNQKPPYRRYFLIHHLAYANNKEGFDQLRGMCKLNLTLLTSDQKTASEVAIEQGHNRLAQYLESFSPEMRALREKHQQENQKAQVKQQTQNQAEQKQNEQLEKDIRRLGGDNLLDIFTCPLTKTVFQDPVVLSDGFTYERAAIQQWLNLGKKTSPMTNMLLPNTDLVPNTVIKQALNEIAEKQKK